MNELNNGINSTLGLIVRGNIHNIDDMVRNVEADYGVTIVFNRTSNDRLYITDRLVTEEKTKGE